MDAKQALKALEAAGTAQNRKVYGRHGVKGPMFGVSYAELGKLKKRIGTDHGLALELWKSGNHDARVLAAMVADPERATARQLEGWLKDCHDHVAAHAVAQLAGRSPKALEMAQTWIGSKKEFVAAVGWDVLAMLAQARPDVPDAVFAKLLKTIESTLQASPNRARYSMNGALISIGLRGGDLRERALAAAERIGPVDVDHGETGCKTPQAAAYIRKAEAYRAKKKKAKATKKKSSSRKTRAAR